MLDSTDFSGRSIGPSPPQPVGTGINLSILFDAIQGQRERHRQHADRVIERLWLPSLRRGGLPVHDIEDLLHALDGGPRDPLAVDRFFPGVPHDRQGIGRLWREESAILKHLKLRGRRAMFLPTRRGCGPFYGWPHLLPAEAGALAVFLARCGFDLDWQRIVAAVALPRPGVLFTSAELGCFWGADRVAKPFDLEGAGVDERPGRWCRVTGTGALVWLCGSRLRVPPASASRAEQARILSLFYEPAVARAMVRGQARAGRHVHLSKQRAAQGRPVGGGGVRQVRPAR